MHFVALCPLPSNTNDKMLLLEKDAKYQPHKQPPTLSQIFSSSVVSDF
ncbi:MAG: hypothetical protein UZ12_BCD005000781 [Bacteroidetes bacterium OLB12]|nr:MAG: hypothetical protein UZ12_BCD005000781 [Bacteroidetes bacterium OLB12]